MDENLSSRDKRTLRLLRNALSVSSAWQAGGFLDLVPNWSCLDAVVGSAPDEEGIYVLGLPCAIGYDKAPTRIIYIGGSRKLRDRLKTHGRHSHNKMIRTLSDAFGGNLYGAYWPVPGLHWEFLRALEGETLITFEQVFGSLPICNLDVPESFDASEYCRGLIRLSQQQDYDTCMSLEALAAKLGCVVDRTTLRPFTDSIFSVTYDGEALKFNEHPLFSAVAFRTQEELDARREYESHRAHSPEFEAQMCMLELTLVHDVNIAAWSVGKMREVLRLCQSLRPLKTKAKIVQAFEAPYREVPEPHTWGEVALIQARLVAESWQPGKHVWVRIMHNKELLGEGKLNTGWYVGEDKSDLPQRGTPRPKWSEGTTREYKPIEFGPGDYRCETVLGVEIKRLKPEARERIPSLIDIGDELRREQESLWAMVEDLLQTALRVRESDEQ